MKQYSLEEIQILLKEPIPTGITITEFMNLKLKDTGWSLEALTEEINRITPKVKTPKNGPCRPPPKTYQEIAQRMRKKLSEDEYLQWVRDRHAQ